MAHLRCPECRLGLHVRYASLTERCPRCWSRRRVRVPLEMTFEGLLRRESTSQPTAPAERPE